MSERQPLDLDRLGPRDPWRFEVVAASPSTNADVAARFRSGEPAGLVLVAEHQTAGRGRLDRVWETPDRAALTVSFLVTPRADVSRWPWLPLVTGVAVAEAVRRVAGLDVGLKWPNDVLVGRLKVAGILVERVEGPSGAAAVIGVGLNVTQSRSELPVDTATSLALEAVTVDRTDLLLGLADSLGAGLAAWETGASQRAAYLALCRTVGQRVRVEQPGGDPIEGEAVDVGEDGRLVVRTKEGEQRLGAGDVVHVRAV